MTLDEVIKTYEYTYENDPVAWTYGVDALHYLKEYRDKAHKLDIDIAEHHRSFEQLGIEIARYQEAVKRCEEAENKYKMLSDKLEGFPTADITQNLRY